MGFTIHQPVVGAPLQFYPAMGSKQLDDLIDTYVPGSASILDKRATVSMEFFEYSIQTGDLFKFFLVYPALASATASPASSGTMQDSGYGSSFNTSPVISESQWTQASTSSFTTFPNIQARAASKKATSSTSRSGTNDFSHLPGMKIMTKDGQDVTNSASRGCKTKEQRDHAHLMRIIKACPDCKRKKVRCDPSHKRSSSQASSFEAKVTKKPKKTAPRPVQKPTEASESVSPSIPVDSMDVSFATGTDNWEQFVNYDEPADVIPFDYDLFFDPARYFSPTTSNSASVSPSQVFTPAQPVTPTGVEHANVIFGDGQVPTAPTLPYLQQQGVDVGNNYVDFNLYSPESSFLDEDPTFSTELAAASSTKPAVHPPSVPGGQPSVSRYPRNDGLDVTSDDTTRVLVDRQVNRVVDRVFSDHFLPEEMVETNSRSDPPFFSRESEESRVSTGEPHDKLVRDLSHTAGSIQAVTTSELPRLKSPVTSARSIGASSLPVVAVMKNSASPAVANMPLNRLEDSSSNQQVPRVAASMKRLKASVENSDSVILAPRGVTRSTPVRIHSTSANRSNTYDVSDADAANTRPLETGKLNCQHHRIALADNNTTDIHGSCGDVQTYFVRNSGKSRLSSNNFAADGGNNYLLDDSISNALRTCTPRQGNVASSQAPSPLPTVQCSEERPAQVYLASGINRSSTVISTQGKSSTTVADGNSKARLLNVVLDSSRMTRQLFTPGIMAGIAILAIVLAMDAWRILSSVGNSNQGLMSVTLIALPFVATRQGSAPCMNKLDPFTQALRVTRNICDAIDNVNSKIQGFTQRVSDMSVSVSFSTPTGIVPARLGMM